MSLFRPKLMCLTPVLKQCLEQSWESIHIFESESRLGTGLFDQGF